MIASAISQKFAISICGLLGAEIYQVLITF